MSISRRSTLPVYALGVVIGAIFSYAWTRELSLPRVSAQSAIWQVIAEPETVAGVSLSIVRHGETKHCLVVVQSGTGLFVASDYNTTGLCNTPEETEEWKRQRLAFEAELGRDDEASSQPSADQTSKQPGVPKP